MPVAVTPRRMKITEKLATKIGLRSEDAAPADVVELGDRDAGHRGEVSRHEWQDAGGQERDDACAERRKKTDSGCWIALHSGLNGTPRGLLALKGS